MRLTVTILGRTLDLSFERTYSTYEADDDPAPELPPAQCGTAYSPDLQPTGQPFGFSPWHPYTPTMWPDE